VAQALIKPELLIPVAHTKHPKPSGRADQVLSLVGHQSNRTLRNEVSAPNISVDRPRRVRSHEVQNLALVASRTPLQSVRVGLREKISRVEKAADVFRRSFRRHFVDGTRKDNDHPAIAVDVRWPAEAGGYGRIDEGIEGCTDRLIFGVAEAVGRIALVVENDCSLCDGSDTRLSSDR
jgi:hypothetical protein